MPKYKPMDLMAFNKTVMGYHLGRFKGYEWKVNRSVKNLKGNDRPIQYFDDRAIILDAINSVDMVVGFDDDTPDKIIKELLPNILIKGGDYSIDNVVGADTVISHGGSVEIIDLIPDKSTSSLIDKILKLK